MDELLRPDDPALLKAVQEYISQGLGGKKDASKPDWTALHWFAATNDSDPVDAQAWVAAGGNPNAQTDNGDTPLHITAWRGSVFKSRFLLRLGASPNVPNHKKHTPLHQALRKKNAWLACEMDAAGGDWGLQDEDGMCGISHALVFLNASWHGATQGQTTFPEGTHEALLVEILGRQPQELWDLPFSHKSPYIKVRDFLEDEGPLAVIASRVLAAQMDQAIPEGGLRAPRRPASRF